MFQEITEELHYLCPIAEDPSNEGNENESRQRQMSEDDIFNGVHVLIGQDHYKMERQILTWSPLDKLRSLDQMEVCYLATALWFAFNPLFRSIDQYITRLYTSKHNKESFKATVE